MSVDWLGFSLIVLLVGMTYTAFTKRFLILTISTAGLWVLVLIFITNNATLSSEALNLLVVATIGIVIALAVKAFAYDIRAKSSTQEFAIFDEEEHGGVKGAIKRLSGEEMPSPPKSHSGMTERAEEYRKNRVHPALKRKR